VVFASVLIKCALFQASPHLVPAAIVYGTLADPNTSYGGRLQDSVAFQSGGLAGAMIYNYLMSISGNLGGCTNVRKVALYVYHLRILVNLYMSLGRLDRNAGLGLDLRPAGNSVNMDAESCTAQACKDSDN
jgi:hypothetical protein